MNCSNCGAPLPPKSGLCKHCGTLNDIDLRGLFDVACRTPDETRNCPRCDEHLESLDLGFEQPFFIERCRKCLGLFFDPGELELLMRAKADAPLRVDRTRLRRILKEEAPIPPDMVRYVKCPTCKVLMNRRSAGALAGVVIDECRDHGVWLDGGELRQILKWVKVGGPDIEKQRKADRARNAAARTKFNRMTAKPEPNVSILNSDVPAGGYGDVVHLVGWLISSILRTL